MKKILLMIGVVTAAICAFAGPHGCGPCGPGWGPRPCGPGWGHRPPPPHCHGGWWGRGGCNFWPGFVGGVIGGAVASAIVDPAPVVVTTPVVTTPVVTRPVVVQQPVVVSQPVVVTPVTQTQNVWVERRYVDQVQANGSVIRTWQPGHYETLTVVVQ